MSREDRNSNSAQQPPQAQPSQAPNGSSSSSSQDPAAAPMTSSSQAEMAQAFRDLARGEQHAAALEANLTSLESKLDALLASVEGAAGPPGRAVDEGVGKGDREGRQQDADAKDGKDRSG